MTKDNLQDIHYYLVHELLSRLYTEHQFIKDEMSQKLIMAGIEDIERLDKIIMTEINK